MSNLYNYQDVQLSVVKNLNSRVLNSSFKKLNHNDNSTIPLNDYVPNVWERKWFNDTEAAGYNIGECVWKYIYNKEEFLSSFGDAVYGYCQENNKLRSYIDKRWLDVCDGKLREKYLTAYMNVISGYADYSYEYISGEYRTIITKIYDSLYEFGERKYDNQRIQIYMSLKNNNKDELSNTASWRNAIISDYEEYVKFVTDNISTMFEDHINDYHLGGLLSVSQFDEKLIKKDMSNFDPNEVYNTLRIRDYDQVLNQEGLDYVIQFAKMEYDVESGGKTYKLYRMFRLWYSGYLEHFGIIPNPLMISSYSEDPRDYTISVDLDWEYNDITGKTKQAKIYDYPLTTADDKCDSKLYYANGHIEVVENEIKVYDKTRYSVNITPIYFNISSDIVDEKIIDFKYLSKNGYPERWIENKNRSYLNIEVHHMKNNSFEITKSNTDDLQSNTPVQFYSYHTTGYRLNDKDNYTDITKLDITIKPLEFKWDGQGHRPEIGIVDHDK